MQKDNCYYMPAEWAPHEGTWLAWPHDKGSKGPGYREKLEPIWIAMTEALHKGERVHIAVYDEAEKAHVSEKLREAGITDNTDFLICKTDDIWIRDSGPIFVQDDSGRFLLTNWNFNGWGERFPHENDKALPDRMRQSLGMEMVGTAVCLEGGGIEVNGAGTLLAAKTSILNANRNPRLTQAQIEAELRQKLGVSNFIWITGLYGDENGGEVTDFHIDGAARFADENTILYEYDFAQSGGDTAVAVMEKHYQELRHSRGVDGGSFLLTPVPMTKEVVRQAGCKGSYLNYYVGNEVVLVPVYGDENDALALKIIEGYFPGRRVVAIDVCELFAHGGMIHCVTQQQPGMASGRGSQSQY